MALRINDEAPNFTAETTQGPINVHEWIGDGWAILFSHPKDFTPVCTTELGYMAGLAPEFARRRCKILGISVDGVRDHEKWSKDIETSQGHTITRSRRTLTGGSHRCPIFEWCPSPSSEGHSPRYGQEAAALVNHGATDEHLVADAHADIVAFAKVEPFSGELRDAVGNVLGHLERVAKRVANAPQQLVPLRDWLRELGTRPPETAAASG